MGFEWKCLAAGCGLAEADRDQRCSVRAETEGAWRGMSHPLTVTALLELVVHAVHASTKHLPAQGQRGTAGRSPTPWLFLVYFFLSFFFLFGLRQQKGSEKLAPLSH